MFWNDTHTSTPYSFLWDSMKNSVHLWLVWKDNWTRPARTCRLGHVQVSFHAGVIYEQNNHKGLSVTASQQNYDRKFYIGQASLSRTQPQKQMCFVQVYANQEGLWVIIKLVKIVNRLRWGRPASRNWKVQTISHHVYVRTQYKSPLRDILRWPGNKHVARRNKV